MAGGQGIGDDKISARFVPYIQIELRQIHTSSNQSQVQFVGVGRGHFGLLHYGRGGRMIGPYDG
jgi:hypothetical protein